MIPVNNFNNLKGPIVDRNGIGFFKTGNHIDLIKESILRLIFTRKGTRMGNLSFGTMIPDLAFTSNSEGLLNIITYEISEALAKFEPRIQLININLIDIVDDTVSFNIVFQEKITNTTQELPVVAEFV